jgi:acyl dehydratase
MRLDFAATHWSERIAREVGLPDIILHGPFTLAKTLEIVNDWTGDPGAIVEHHIRLRKPVVVPDDGVGAVFDVTGVVRDKLDGNRVVLELTATSPAGELLATADVTVVLKA